MNVTTLPKPPRVGLVIGLVGLTMVLPDDTPADAVENVEVTDENVAADENAAVVDENAAVVDENAAAVGETGDNATDENADQNSEADAGESQ